LVRKLKEELTKDAEDAANMLIIFLRSFVLPADSENQRD
jgi:hypothetical protein